MKRVLIVEDEERLAAFIEKGLRKNGFTTAVVYDGEQALEMAVGKDFGLLLLDLGLPQKDGWAVLKELRSRKVKIPIIIITATSEDSNRQLAFSLGADDYVNKPFRFSDLLDKVKSHSHQN
ncbi:MAG: response regulator [Calothrix sp. C42_A2020_038]|nr:response regulator [Calothrix sp. C42_A2020_038]